MSSMERKGQKLAMCRQLPAISCQMLAKYGNILVFFGIYWYIAAIYQQKHTFNILVFTFIRTRKIQMLILRPYLLRNFFNVTAMPFNPAIPMPMPMISNTFLILYDLSDLHAGHKSFSPSIKGRPHFLQDFILILHQLFWLNFYFNPFKFFVCK